MPRGHFTNTSNVYLMLGFDEDMKGFIHSINVFFSAIHRNPAASSLFIQAIHARCENVSKVIQHIIFYLQNNVLNQQCMQYLDILYKYIACMCYDMNSDIFINNYQKFKKC